MNDPFDFTAFIANASNADDETKKEILRDEVSDAMDAVMGEVAPRIWSVLQEQMMKDPKSSIHLNAVINSAIFATFGWLAACTPQGETSGKDNGQILRETVMKNLDNALENARDQGGHMSMIAHNAGKLKLMEDAMAGLAQTLTANSMIIQGIHKTLGNKPDA